MNKCHCGAEAKVITEPFEMYEVTVQASYLKCEPCNMTWLPVRMEAEIDTKIKNELYYKGKRLEEAADKILNARPCRCGDVGYFVVMNNTYDYHGGEPEQEQCEFCYTDPDSRFKAIEDYKKLRGIK